MLNSLYFFVSDRGILVCSELIVSVGVIVIVPDFETKGLEFELHKTVIGICQEGQLEF